MRGSRSIWSPAASAEAACRHNRIIKARAANPSWWAEAHHDVEQEQRPSTKSACHTEPGKLGVTADDAGQFRLGGDIRYLRETLRRPFGDQV
jgi:hypothetical protein